MRAECGRIGIAFITNSFPFDINRGHQRTLPRINRKGVRILWRIVDIRRIVPSFPVVVVVQIPLGRYLRKVDNGICFVAIHIFSIVSTTHPIRTLALLFVAGLFNRKSCEGKRRDHSQMVQARTHKYLNAN